MSLDVRQLQKRCYMAFSSFKRRVRCLSNTLPTLTTNKYHSEAHSHHKNVVQKVIAVFFTVIKTRSMALWGIN